MKRILLLSIIATCYTGAFADQNIEIVGGSGSGNPKIAIINFDNDDGSIVDEITNDFKMTGEFNVINAVSKDAIDPSIKYVIKGSVVSDPTTGQSSVSYTLTSNESSTVLLNKSVAFNDNSKRKAVHSLDNAAYKAITQTPGIFTSKIAVATKKGPKYSLVVADFDGYNPKTLLTTNRPVQSLAWNNSGNSISYVTYEKGKPVVYVQNLAEGSRYEVANFNGSNSSPAFAPDNQKLAVTLSKDYGSHIYLVNNKPYNSMSKAIPLVNYGTIDTEADISKNGNLIFTSDHDGGPQIFMSDLYGSAPTRVTQNLGNYNTTARYSNDASKITFINRNSGTLRTYVLDLTTKSAYPISQGTVHDLSPSFAPNDKLVLFSSDNFMYISNITGTTQTKLKTPIFGQIIDQKWAKDFD
jgi:TolB protein